MPLGRSGRAAVVAAACLVGTFALAAPAAAQTTYYHEVVETPGPEWNHTSLALEADGTPHISYTSYQLKQIKHAVKRGTCWSSEVVQTLTGGATTTSLVLDGAGSPHIVFDDGSPPQVSYAYKSGGAWVIESIGPGGDPSLALDAQGRVHVAFANEGELWYALRTGPGSWQRTWVGPNLYGGQGTDNDIALDAAGNPRIVYEDYTYDDLRYTEFRDGAWHDELVDDGSTGRLHAQLALDSQGRPHLAYYDVGAGRIHYATRTPGGWSIEEFRPVGTLHEYPGLALDSQDRPHISYRNNGLEYAVKDGGVWQIHVVDQGYDIGWYTSLALDAAGRPHISYTGFDSLLYHELSTMPVVCTPPNSDRFDGAAIDLSKWVISSPLNNSTVTQDGRLNITSDGTAGRFPFTPLLIGPGAGVATKCRLTGDFDIQVDFSDYTAQFVNHTQAFFGIYQDDTHQIHIKRLRGATVDGIQTCWTGGCGGVTPFSGTAGRFRITRTGSVLTTYFDGGSGFIVHEPGRPLFAGDVVVSLMLLAPGGKTASVRYDNYIVNRGAVVCPTGEVAGTVLASCAGQTAPREGVAVTLLQGGSARATTNTLADGSYGFADVLAGDYTVAVTPPPAYGAVVGEQAVTVTGGGTATADFSLYCLVGDIAGTVSATCSGATAPAAGVAVALLQAGVECAAGTTLPNGTYLFAGVPLGTYTVALTPPEGYGTPVDHHVVSLLAGGETAAADFSLVCLLGSLAVSVVGECDGAQAPLQGVTVDVYSVGEGGEESLVGTAATGADGLVRYDDIALGEYRAVVVSPLGYLTDPAWQQVTLAEPGGLTTAAFTPLCQAIAAQPRNMGYWKHQVNVYLSGKGHAQETLDDLLRYIDLMVEHFNGNLVNPVIVYVPVGEHPGDRLLQLSQLLTVNRGGTDLDRAKRQLLALLLNVVSGKLAQAEVISVDGATASQAITHCHDLITDGLAGNDATADRIAEYVNSGVVVPAGLVPVETRVITYHRDAGTEALRLALESVRPNPSPDGFAVWFTVPRPGQASLTLYDVSGRRVWEKDLGELAPGRHLVGAADGPRLAAGVYLLRLTQLGESVGARVAIVR